MKYILKGNNDYLNPTQTIFSNRGIDDSLFQLDDSVIEDYHNYDNIQEGIELLIKHINNNIAMVVDPDFDGFSSFAMLYNYLNIVFPNIKINIVLHSGKQHGLSSDIEIENNINLVILADSSSNDFKQHQQLKEKGIDVLVIDHHQCDQGYSPYAVVINNQLSNKIKNKNLSGSGVVLKFLRALDDYLFEDKANEFIDISAYGNIADVMDLHEKETRYLVYQGLNNVNNLFIKALIETKSYALENKFNINSIGWVISPLINATVRSATMEEKLKMAQAFISNDYEFCLEVAKMCTNIKARQDSAVKSALKKIQLKINIKEEDRCIILDVGKNLNKNHTGLVAGKIADKYKLPTLLYREVENKKGFVGGSFRGIDSISLDLRIDVLNSGLVNYSMGHGQAGGFECDKNNVEKLKQYLNKLYKDKEVIDSKIYEVDLILEEETLDYNIIFELAQYEDEWGNGIDVPLIAFENITIDINDDNIKGTKAKNMIFEINGVKFIKKYLSNVLKDSVLNKGELQVSIVGKIVNNIYNDVAYPQVEIVELAVNN